MSHLSKTGSKNYSHEYYETKDQGSISSSSRGFSERVGPSSRATPRSNTIFPGFKNGGHICDVLTKSHNPDLKAFIAEFFRQVSQVNQAGREERYVAKDRKFFDAVAQILTGNEVCAAVAMDRIF